MTSEEVRQLARDEAAEIVSRASAARHDVAQEAAYAAKVLAETTKIELGHMAGMMDRIDKKIDGIEAKLVSGFVTLERFVSVSDRLGKIEKVLYVGGCFVFLAILGAIMSLVLKKP